MFKVGDRVVDISRLDYGICEIYIVTDKSIEYFYYSSTGRRNVHTSLNDPDLILEEIYNSPLYQALSECNEELKEEN